RHEGLDRTPRVVHAVDALLTLAAGPHVEGIELEKLAERRHPLSLLLLLDGLGLQRGEQIGLGLPRLVFARAECGTPEATVGHTRLPDPLAVVLDPLDRHHAPPVTSTSLGAVTVSFAA